MEKKIKNEELEKTIINEHVHYVQQGDNENALNIFIRQMGVRPSSKISFKCYSQE